MSGLWGWLWALGSASPWECLHILDFGCSLSPHCVSRTQRSTPSSAWGRKDKLLQSSGSELLLGVLGIHCNSQCLEML